MEEREIRKRIKTVIALLTVVVMLPWMDVNAEATYELPEVVRCTCYVLDGITKSGTQTRTGVVSGKEEWLGSICVLYQIDKDGSIGDYIGQFMFEDTGSNKGIVNGTSIDVWQPSMEDAYSWVEQYGDYVYMQVIPGKG